MIEINLYPGKGTGAGDTSSVDFNDISIKGMIVAAIVWLGAQFVGPTIYKSRLESWDTKLVQMRQEVSQIKVKMKELKGLQREIDAAKAEEKLLYDQLNIIKEVTTDKRNPMKLLVYLAKHIPENTWITNVKVQGRKIEIEGRSFSYGLIGKLFESFQSSIFFQGTPILDVESVKGSEEDNIGRRLEKFTIKGTVKQFE